MEIRDVIVTPVVILAVLFVAYFIRPRVTDDLTRKYFLPALVLKIFGAIVLGFIYQFYYSGGDTFNYHTHGSRHMWEAIIESPLYTIVTPLTSSQGRTSTEVPRTPLTSLTRPLEETYIFFL